MNPDPTRAGETQHDASQTVSIAEVAEAAGVSTTTVSHVFSGRRPVAAATQRRVTDAARRLGYRPSAIARALRLGRTRTVALITQDLTNPFYPALARGLQQVLAAADHALMLLDTGGDNPSGPHAVDVCLERQVDGIVVAVDGIAEDLRRIPPHVQLVGVGPEFLRHRGGQPSMDVAMSDDVEIGRDVAEYLLLRGHREIAVVAGPEGLEPSLGRLKGFRETLAAAGVTLGAHAVVHGDWTVESGTAGLTSLLRSGRPTAVFAANDLMALGVLRGAVAHHLSVPKDLAIVGVDDIDASALVAPTLTTVHLRAAQIGREAGALLLSRLDGGPPARTRTTVVPHFLVTRESA